MKLKQALEVLVKTAETDPKLLGRLFWQTDESGHAALCRLLRAIAHYGPGGTFVIIDSTKLDAGGSLCTFGIQCGEPTESHTQHLHECWEEEDRIMRILKASGALVSHCYENPRFSPGSLCRCGKPEEHGLPHHDPLCPYRIEHDQGVTIEEYREALKSGHA